MKMYERLIPEWQHAVNLFCEMENIKEWVLQNDSTSSRYVAIREKFYAYCVAIGIPMNDMIKATGQSRGAVYHAFDRKHFRSYVKEYSDARN